MKQFKSIIPILGVLLIIFSCGKNVNPEPIKIGSQTWAAKNLDVSTFRNGDIIQEAKSNDEWVKAGNIYYFTNIVASDIDKKQVGFSLRCIKD